MLRFLLITTLVAAASSGLAAAQGGAPAAQPGAAQADRPAAPPTIPPLGQDATQRLVYGYDEAEHWAMRAIMMLSLGTDWHPDGVPMLAKALGDRDKRLPPFAVETVLRTSDRVIGAIATKELVAAMIDALDSKNDLLRERAAAALARLAPDGGCADRREWQRWWRDAEKTWQPAQWAPTEVEDGEGTVTRRLVERAFDLRDAGLEVVFVIDTTGSMQVAINAARDAIDDVSSLLAGITDKLELGLVHYKDFGDLGDGAKLLEPLTRRHDKVKDRLAKLIAGGGGDAPERVEKGVEVALARETRWTKDANRMILIVGDAPPHEETMDALLETVRRAHDQPFEKGRGPATGGKNENKLRPFITSAIATSPAAKDHFAKIAAAGGGTCVLLETGRAPKGGRGARAAEQIAEHVLLQSFGSGYEAQLHEFVRLFFTYRRAGAFD